MKRFWTATIFIFINFIALAIGAFLMGNEVISDWYQDLDKAPWTPPGWVFGAAWTFIMICFGIFMGQAWNKVVEKRKLLVLYILHWLLNVAWNPIFFSSHMVFLGLVVITILWGLMLYFMIRYSKEMKWWIVLVAPYVIWLAIATSLNAFIYIYN